MSQRDEPWVRAAMYDDAVVAEILVRLHHGTTSSSSHHPPPPPPTNLKALNWTVRQRRSKLPKYKKPSSRHHHRASPSTPLSWSAGSEESTRSHNHVHVSTVSSDLARSKVNNNEGSEKEAASKKLRKRKTLAELRNEESSLLKERRDLKREITALRVNLEKQWATNENLKKIKNDLQQPFPDCEVSSYADASIPLPPDSLVDPPTISKAEDVPLQQSSSNVCLAKNADSASCKKILIPDLNIPFEEDIIATEVWS